MQHTASSLRCHSKPAPIIGPPETIAEMFRAAVVNGFIRFIKRLIITTAHPILGLPWLGSIGMQLIIGPGPGTFVCSGINDMHSTQFITDRVHASAG